MHDQNTNIPLIFGAFTMGTAQYEGHKMGIKGGTVRYETHNQCFIKVCVGLLLPSNLCPNERETHVS